MNLKKKQDDALSGSLFIVFFFFSEITVHEAILKVHLMLHFSIKFDQMFTQMIT